MLKMVDGTGIIGVDMVCPLGGTVSPPQPPNYDKVEVEGVGSLMLPNSLKAPLERVELLGNSVQGENPSPDNPQEIKSAGRKSENIFNKNAVKQGYEFGAMLSDAETVKQGWFVSDFMPVKATTYQISGKKTGAGCKLYSKDKVFVKNIQAAYGQIKFDEGIAYFRINGEIKDLDNIQVEEGTVATDYEPYSDTCLLDVKVTGKNLFNAEKAKDANNWTISAILPSYKEFSIYVGKGNSVNISYLENLETGLGFYANIAHSKNDYTMYWLYHSDSEINITKNKNFIAMNDYIILRVDSGSVPKFFEYIKTLQIEIGSKQTPYEPYTEQTVQIALDEPLRGIGEYKDTITKDGVVRKIKRIMFDENTPFKEYNAPVQVKTTSFISGTTIKDATGETGIEVMSDRFKAKDRGFDRYDEECITLFGRSIFVRFNKDKNINTEEALTEWLKQNPLTVDYVLAEPVTEPLPESVQAQLQALHSENGVTHVFVDSGEVPCGIKLTYRKEK